MSLTMRFKGYTLCLLVLPIVLLLSPALSEGKRLKIFKKYKDSIQTNILGTSETTPPYVKVIRSKKAVSYMLREFEEIKNYGGVGKVRQLKKKLNRINFNKHMLIAVLTQPIDNYSMKVIRTNKNLKNKRVEIDVVYSHRNKSYNIPPKKSIYYAMIVVPKSDLPVMPKLIEKRARARKKDKPVYVTGRLLYWKYSDLQLVPVKIKRKKSIIYYIKGRQVKRLEKYVGRVVKLKGKVIRDQDSPYQKDLEVEKVVKIIEN
ncbi:MAG: hypothetical protein ACE5FU_01100 [Nitrospinota bacterium]